MIYFLKTILQFSLFCGLLVTLVISKKYRICVVDGRGGFKKSIRYCPTLDASDSRVECIVALDRLDCLRRISKGSVDFSVFTAEDLVTATNSQIEVLITNILKYTKDNYEYEVVAVIDNNANIKNRHDLKDKRFCHPGYGYEKDFTNILTNYLEFSVVPQQCNPILTVTENRIKATSDFFKSSCKAGPWVNNISEDVILKNKYPNLCSLCDNPNTCSTRDKYWGRRGPLLCLSDGAGDITWARLDDVKVHFGLIPGGAEATAQGYSYLCPDNSIRLLNSTNPCVWVVKPWSVVAAKRTNAQEIQNLIANLTYNDPIPWKSAVYNLIESSHLTVEKLEPMEPIESYLDKATGFLSANSFSGCHPPRTIKICTTSIIENAKCSWLRESAAVYGIEPDIECLKADNTTHCIMALNENAADVVLVPSDLVHTAISDYNLKTLFYETVHNNEKYITVAITKKNVSIKSFENLRGKKVCFPIFDGVAWNSAVHTLYKKKILNGCHINNAMAEFFGPSCAPGASKIGLSKFTEVCENHDEVMDREMSAIHCLTSGQGDVAFVSKNSLQKFVDLQRDSIRNKYQLSDFKILCASNDTNQCHLSWAPVGYGMVRNNSSDLWLKDTLDVFLQLDNLFGKNYPSFTSPFTLFGPYDGVSNVLFQDVTVKLRQVPTIKNTDFMPFSYTSILEEKLVCVGSSIVYNSNNLLLLFIFLIVKYLN